MIEPRIGYFYLYSLSDSAVSSTSAGIPIEFYAGYKFNTKWSLGITYQHHSDDQTYFLTDMTASANRILVEPAFHYSGFDFPARVGATIISRPSGTTSALGTFSESSQTLFTIGAGVGYEFKLLPWFSLHPRTILDFSIAGETEVAAQIQLGLRFILTSGKN